MGNNNVYYECQCIYLKNGYILCKTCAEWIDQKPPKQKPIYKAKRWERHQHPSSNTTKGYLIMKHPLSHN